MVVMGIYPDENRVTQPTWDEERQVYVWTEERNPYDGATYRREVTATKWVEYERRTCYCCSCYHGDYSQVTDAYCRNHGWAGSRACEVHRMRGTGKAHPDDFREGEPYVVDLEKLNTVQQENRLNAELEAR